MPPRVQIRIACQRCRRKRAKCDGKEPCRGCTEVGENCEYDHSRRESKDDLRSIVWQLERHRAETERLLRGIVSVSDPIICKALLQGLVDGERSNQDIIKELKIDVDNEEAGPSKPAPLQHTSPAESAVTGSDTSSGQPFDQMITWRFCRPSSQPAYTNLPTESRETFTILSFPPRPLDAYIAHSYVDRWTRTGWTTAHIRHLYDALITWDYLPFCLLQKDIFLRDYHSGSGQFCSAALVHSILALATRLINEGDDDTVDLLPSGWVKSELFFKEAETIIDDGAPINSLPDIQALGMLSLYHMRCGREAEALSVAETFAASITGLCQREPLTGKEDKEYAKSRATTSSGAVSLVRLLSLTTGQIFNASCHADEGVWVYLDQLSNDLEGDEQQTDSLRSNLAVDPDAYNLHNPLFTPANLFQICNWVHKLIVSTRSASTIASDVLEAVHTKCLQWYDSFFAHLKFDGSRTPFVLFIHMYYHFCLLCAFRPFIGVTLEGSNISPKEICIQAAQSILALAQSYDDLFTLRRVSGFIPYFVCASGLLSLAMKESGSHLDAVHLRLGDNSPYMLKADIKGKVPGAETEESSTIPSHIKMSTLAHARLLLAKMGSTHPAAMMAERMFRKQTGV